MRRPRVIVTLDMEYDEPVGDEPDVAALVDEVVEAAERYFANVHFHFRKIDANNNPMYPI